MSLSAGDIEYARDLFSDIPDLSTRRMFGGLGLYAAGTIFAVMLSDGRIMLKAVKGPFADHMDDIGGTKWTYTRKSGASAAMPYWTVPEYVLDDRDALTDLSLRALAHLNA